MVKVWISYVFPLVIATLFFLGGLAMFRDRKRKENGYGRGATPLGTVFMAIGGTVILAILLASPTPFERQRLVDHVFHTPPDQIERFAIEPDRLSTSLAKAEVVISDPARIQQIAKILSAASECSWGRSSGGRWRARIEMVTRDGKYYFCVEGTMPGDSRSAIVTVWTKPTCDGWMLGSIRAAEGLAKVLEDAVSAAREH